MSEAKQARLLIRGSKRIAEYLGDPSMYQVLRINPGDFGLFRVGGKLAGYTDELDSVMAAKRAAGVIAPPCRTRRKEAVS
jgi:hypothetical protein